MSEQAYPTREQAALLASNTCKIEGCYDCTAIKWCGDETINIMAYGQSILAMHDALDAKQAEIDRLREYLRDVQGELLIRFDNHEMPDLNMIEIAQRIDAFLSPSCDGED